MERKHRVILVTGGAGYIGSHTVRQLLDSGHDVLVLDNLCNSSCESLRRVEQLTGKTIYFVEGDIRDAQLLDNVFNQYAVTAVIHFAGLKAVGESTKLPLKYYENNFVGTLNLCRKMAQHGVFKLVFSSSATVYSLPEQSPLDEFASVGKATNPYGTSKWMVEQMLQDLAVSEKRWRIVTLRYFNPVGAHPSGLIGEDPNDIPNNLLPYITQVAVGKLAKLSIFGDDYETSDGTGVRDYIHVEDLASGHLCALAKLETDSGVHVYNLGTGQGCSVLQMVTEFERVNSVSVPYVFVARRPGDVASYYANPTKAYAELGWKCQYGLADMLRHSWLWQKNNPNGYRSIE